MDEVLLTYAELSEALGIKVPSAKKLAQRRKWARIVGNDGLARVRVPREAVPRDVEGDVHGDVSPPVSPRDDHLLELVEALKGQVEAERRRAEAAEARVRDLEGDRDAWKHQAQRSLWSRIWGK